MSWGNFVRVVIPKHRHKRMRVTESWSGIGIKSGLRQYDVCKICYKPMTPYQEVIDGENLTIVADFTDMPGGGVPIDNLIDALNIPPNSESKANKEDV